MFIVAGAFCGLVGRQLRLSLKYHLTGWLGWQVSMGSARNSALIQGRRGRWSLVCP